MTTTPEQEARKTIDQMLSLCGWDVQDYDKANINAMHGVAIRNFSLTPGHGFADYLLYVNGRAAGVIEAKKVGNTLTGVEIQSDKYKTGLPESLPAWFRPLPFCYQSTGVETRFTNDLDPVPRSRNVFAFHRPETLEGWLGDGKHLEALIADMINALSPDRQEERARQDNPQSDPPTAEQMKQAGDSLAKEAVKPLYIPDLRTLLLEIKKKIVYDMRNYSTNS